MDMRGLMIFTLTFAVPAFAGEWKFKAFQDQKVHLVGGNLKPSAVPESNSSSLRGKVSVGGFPLLLLVNNECLLKRGGDVFADLNFAVKHKNSAALKIEARAVRYEGSLSLEQLSLQLTKETCIAGLTENPEVISQSVNDPLYSDQAALPAISQVAGERFFYHALWGIRRDVTVAVVDSGAQLDHPDLASRLWRSPEGFNGIDMVNDDNDPADDFGHGTHVAGIILAQKDNGVGIRGVMGDWSRLMTVKSQDSAGGGTMADMINAFRWAVDHGAEVVNLSLASRQQNQALVDALDYAVSNKATVVVAAGNDGEQITANNFISPIGYAAGLGGVIGVGSIDANSKLRSNFSNYGASYVEISAPGSPGSNAGILSTFNNGAYAGINGTSMSAPHVAGAAALVTGFLKTHSVTYSPSQIERLILNSAETNSANTNYFGLGRSLNLENLGRYLFNSTFVSGTGGLDD